MRRVGGPTGVGDVLLVCRYDVTGPGIVATGDESHLVVNHILGRGGELGVSLDHLIHSIEHILLRDLLSSVTDGEHTCLCTNGS